jgi:hypothetical protein
MEKKIQKVTTPIILAILVVVLQVLIVRINFIYEPLAMNIEYGVKTAGLLFAMESLSLLSGAALAWMPYKKPQLEKTHRQVNLGLVLLLVFTLLLVTIKMLMMGFGLWSVDFLFSLLSYNSALGQWVYFTPVPSLLAGFSLGSLLRR